MIARVLGVLCIAGALVACGSAVGPAAERFATPPPAATTLPSATAEQAPPTTVVAATEAPPAAPAGRATAVPQEENGLQTSRTAEGYQVLGNPAAAVTLVMYSDFL
jgi:hypothetical protein